jgi:hypothetical protein
MKTCTRCKESKPKTSFRLNKKSNDGLSYQCNECYSKNNYFKKKSNNPPSVSSLASRIRNRITTALKSNELQKRSSTELIVGIPFNVLRMWLHKDYDFVGDEHLDHIIPISWAINIDEVEALNHYSNLRYDDPIRNVSRNNRFVLIESIECVLENHPDINLIHRILDRNKDKVVPY